MKEPCHDIACHDLFRQQVFLSVRRLLNPRNILVMVRDRILQRFGDALVPEFLLKEYNLIHRLESIVFFVFHTPLFSPRHSSSKLGSALGLSKRFYFAQLAPWENNKPITNDGSALLRNAQMTAYKAIPNSGIIGLGDVGSKETVHFPDKKTPGERFALWAMYNEYGDRSVNPMGPVFSSIKAEGGKLVVRLENGEGLHLAAGESSVRYAEIAGADGVFVSADVKIAGDNLLEFSSPKVSAPTQARYCFSGWHEATIFNAAGLPLFPFKANL